MDNKEYSVKNQLFHKSYTNKLVSGIAEQKRKFDACLHWLLIINTAALGLIILKFNESEPIVAICSIGTLWTWMIMLRSASAYRQLWNFDLILSKFHDYYLATNEKSEEKLNLLVKYMTYLDYSHEENIVKVFKKKPGETIRYHLSWEYGPIIFIYAIIIIFKLYLNFSMINIGIVIFLIYFIINISNYFS